MRNETMNDYSFLDHVHAWLGDFIDRYEFSLNQSSSRTYPGFRDNLLSFESPQCQVQIYLEHNRVYIEISALNESDPNLWYNLDIMACFVSKTVPNAWKYDLPRGIPLRQVIEQQLVRWRTILGRYFDQILPLFVSKEKLHEMQPTLDTFVRSFYAEQQKVSLK